MYIIKNWIGTFYKHAQWLQCSGLPRLCFLKRFAKIKQSAYLTQTFPLILWLRTPSKLLITAPGRQFGTENLVNTLINWIRFHVNWANKIRWIRYSRIFNNYLVTFLYILAPDHRNKKKSFLLNILTRLRCEIPGVGYWETSFSIEQN